MTVGSVNGAISPMIAYKRPDCMADPNELWLLLKQKEDRSRRSGVSRYSICVLFLSERGRRVANRPSSRTNWPWTGRRLLGLGIGRPVGVLGPGLCPGPRPGPNAPNRAPSPTPKP